MAFTDPWNVTDPPGTEQARNIDNHIRKLRLQLEERFEAAWVKDFTADPLELRDEVSGFKEGKMLLIPMADIKTHTGEGANESTGGEYVETSTDFFIPIRLPPGVTIKYVELLAHRLSNTFQWELRSRPFGPGSSTIIETVTHSAPNTGIGISITPELNVVVDSNTLYWINGNRVPTNEGRRLYGARVTYNTPNHWSTI